MYEKVLLNCLNNYPSNKSKISIPRIHCAYQDSLQFIQLFYQAHVLDKDLVKKFNKTFSKLKLNDNKLKCLELVLIDEIISLCSHKKERTAVEEQAKKYMSEVNQWQAIVEKGLSFVRNDRATEEFETSIR